MLSKTRYRLRMAQVTEPDTLRISSGKETIANILTVTHERNPRNTSYLSASHATASGIRILVLIFSIHQLKTITFFTQQHCNLTVHTYTSNCSHMHTHTNRRTETHTHPTIERSCDENNKVLNTKDTGNQRQGI